MKTANLNEVVEAITVEQNAILALATQQGDEKATKKASTKIKYLGLIEGATAIAVASVVKDGATMRAIAGDSYSIEKLVAIGQTIKTRAIVPSDDKAMAQGLAVLFGNGSRLGKLANLNSFSSLELSRLLETVFSLSHDEPTKNEEFNETHHHGTRQSDMIISTLSRLGMVAKSGKTFALVDCKECDILRSVYAS
jgi:hypothetical protein